MQNSFDDTSLTPHSLSLEEYWASISVEFADDFPINAQDPTYTCTAPADQGQTMSASAGSPSSMISQAGFEAQLSDPLTQSSSIPMPQFVETGGHLGLYHPLPLTNGGNSTAPHFELQLQLQRLAQSQFNPAQNGHQSSPISPSGSAASAPALSRSSSGRRQATPSASEEDRDNAPLLNLGSNATAKERAQYKREQNKLAARRARRRREAQVSRMESEVVRLQREADIWRERARMMEGLLEKAGLAFPRFPNDV
ncbi:hypothetical protein D9619_007647 [Psilocybe cf. subviscida]|uniref:BZIP domain-containing protein n=1 Tax=Psilocybe cf. subviscida TaxID=2480587 RepID=A0A8H5AV87_9AGAR|nr:hypothetical protein D9619_007647 [Psilocybe cf. subviscida]